MLPEWDRNDGMVNPIVLFAAWLALFTDPLFLLQGGNEEQLTVPPPSPLWMWQTGSVPPSLLACGLLLVSCREEATMFLTSMLRTSGKKHISLVLPPSHFKELFALLLFPGKLEHLASAVLPDVPLAGISPLFLSPSMSSSSSSSSSEAALPVPCPPTACCLFRYHGPGGPKEGVLVASVGSQWPETRSSDLVASLLAHVEPVRV